MPVYIRYCGGQHSKSRIVMVSPPFWPVVCRTVYMNTMVLPLVMVPGGLNLNLAMYR